MPFEKMEIVYFLILSVIAAFIYYRFALKQMRVRYQRRLASGEPLSRIVARDPEKPSSIAMVVTIVMVIVACGLISMFLPAYITMAPWVACLVGGVLCTGLCVVAIVLLSKMNITSLSN